MNELLCHTVLYLNKSEAAEVIIRGYGHYQFVMQVDKTQLFEKCQWLYGAVGRNPCGKSNTSKL